MMGRFFSRRAHPVLLLLAMSFLAVISLLIAIVTLTERLELLEQGQRVAGVVVGIDIGVKGLRRAEVEFLHADRGPVIGLDLHSTQWYSPNEVGDQVMLFYNPRDRVTERLDVLVDRGGWIWSIPAFLFGAAAVLPLLAVFLYRHETGKKNS